MSRRPSIPASSRKADLLADLFATLATEEPAPRASKRVASERIRAAAAAEAAPVARVVPKTIGTPTTLKKKKKLTAIGLMPDEPSASPSSSRKTKTNIRVVKPLSVAPSAAPSRPRSSPKEDDALRFARLLDSVVRAPDTAGLRAAYAAATAAQEAYLAQLRDRLPAEEAKLRDLTVRYQRRVGELASGSQLGGVARPTPKPRPDPVTLLSYKISSVKNPQRLEELYAEAIALQQGILANLRERILAEEARLGELAAAYQARLADLELLEMMSSMRMEAMGGARRKRGAARAVP